MKNNVVIRPYREADCTHIQNICLETVSNQEFSLSEMRDLLLTTFCNYYLEQEPNQCFVADDGGKVIGYILSTKNSAEWAQKINHTNSHSKSDFLGQFYDGVTSMPLKYYANYPAHLHINISAAYQGSGLGLRLMDALSGKLREQGIPGLMLSVAENNSKGIKFYNKYGFKVLEHAQNEVVMGILL